MKKKVSKKQILIFSVLILAVGVIALLFIKKHNASFQARPNNILMHRVINKPMHKPVRPKTAVKQADNNKLKDLFTIKYKHKFSLLSPDGKIMTSSYSRFPALPPPPFKSIGLNKSVKSDLSIIGRSGNYLAVKCGSLTNYLKPGDGSCGYTYLKTSNSFAIFSHNGKIKKIAY